METNRQVFLNEEIKAEELRPNEDSPMPFDMADEDFIEEVDKEDLLMEGLGEEIKMI